jgi:putative endonuclease
MRIFGRNPPKESPLWRSYYVYILTNPTNTVLYTGVTNDLSRRLHEHRLRKPRSFTGRYNVVKLVYYEIFSDPYSAIQREKQIKAGSRAKKIALITARNPFWIDLASELLDA